MPYASVYMCHCALVSYKITINGMPLVRPICAYVLRRFREHAIVHYVIA